MQSYPLLYKMRELMKLSNIYLNHAPSFIDLIAQFVFYDGLKYHKRQALESVLAHAEPTASYNHLINKLNEHKSILPPYLTRRILKWQSTHTLKK